MQKPSQSLIEAITNTSLGMVIAFCLQLIVYPIMDIPVKIEQNIMLTIIFTSSSIGRGFVVRRIFNRLGR